MKKSILTALTLAALLGCRQQKTAPGFSAEAYLQHVRTLSSDGFEGRAPASPGEEKTVSYIVNAFSEYGLEPAFSGSWIQPVPVSAYKVDRKSTTVTLHANGKKQDLEYIRDVMIWPASNKENVVVNNLELVYVGYGIVAPEENWDDYKSLDVKGKVLVFKNSDPYSDPNRFKGNTRLYYGRYDYKYEIAARLGAAGAIIIHTTPTAGYPWTVVTNSWEKEQFRLLSQSDSGATVFNGWLSMESSEKLFEQAGLSLADMLDSAEDPGFTPVPLKNITFSATIASTFRDMSLQNAGAILRARKNPLADEFVVVTAHHDHLGKGAPVRGDSVFNGALDNATGVAAMLNLAEALAGNPAGLERSILFLAVSGEEKGLLGSKYYSAHPSISPASIALNVNIDGMNIAGRTRDLVSIGFGKSTVDAMVEKAASAQNRYVRPDPRPELGYFYRSDHFPFARIGVPVLYISTGRDFIDKPADYFETTLTQYMNERYHTVFDEINDQWDVSGTLEDLALLYGVIRDASTTAHPPVWNKGDEFEKARLLSQQK
jgi:Zn-dependent M28 family amino/carboxypeptidase